MGPQRPEHAPARKGVTALAALVLVTIGLVTWLRRGRKEDGQEQAGAGKSVGERTVGVTRLVVEDALHLPPPALPWPHKMLAFATVLGVLSIVAMNWLVAARSDREQQPRLRWYIVARTPVAVGTRIENAHLARRLARLPENSGFVPAPDRVLGTYTALALRPGDRLIPQCVFTAVPVFPTNSEVVVPVHLKKEDASALQPGMRIALARETVYLPSRAPGDSGFALRAVDRPATGPTVTAMVTVARADTVTLARVVVGEWRAIVLRGPPSGEITHTDLLPHGCNAALPHD